VRSRGIHPLAAELLPNLIHPQTRPIGPFSYYKLLSVSQVKPCSIMAPKHANAALEFHFETASTIQFSLAKVPQKLQSAVLVTPSRCESKSEDQLRR
jgi:hypothetical protein